MSRIQGDGAELAAAPEGKNLSTSARPVDVAAEKGQKTCARPPAQSPQSHKAKRDEEEDEDLKAPLELLIKFLAAVTDRDFDSALHLCQMILVYEPDNPEASEFLPLIQGKLLQEREMEQSCEEDGDGETDESDDDDDDSGSSPSDGDDEEM